jgi:hypothetical protein
MAVLDAQHPTLLDLANRSEPDGKIAKVVELLQQTNEILDDMVFVEGNLPTGHKTTVRTGLPEPTWRKLYGGVQPTKSRTAQITDNCGMLEAYAEVDKALADLNGNTAAFRLSEDYAHIEGMSQELASTLMYASETTEPEAFTGFAPRFNLLTGAENSDNVIDGGSAGGQTDNASIWLVVWGENTCHGIIPKGSTAGLQVTDKGQVTIEDVDGNGGRMEAYRTHYRMDAGLCVRDWRYVVRIANIDKSTLSTTWASGAFSTGVDLTELMYEAIELIPSLGMGRPAFYMSRDIRTKVRQQLSAKAQASVLDYKDIGGRWTETFQDIPMRRVDAMAADETQLS